MSGFVDLHCHWVAGIDDGAKTPEMGIEMLQKLHALGFDTVVATPHMRPGMFDNEKGDLEAAFERMRAHVEAASGVPEVRLSSEHYFDEIVFARLLDGTALPYPGGKAVLLEFYEIDFPLHIRQRLFELRQRRLRPVIAHPERYRCIWKDPARLEELVDGGAVALLDAAALVGKYGKEPRKAAEELLERGLYHAACSDAHRPADVDEVAKGMRAIEKHYDREEVEFLFGQGPREILEGTVST